MKSIFLSKILPALALAIAFSGLASAQSTPPGGGISPANPAAPTGVPLDGGASLLLAGGVAYGLKKLRDRHRSA